MNELKQQIRQLTDARLLELINKPTLITNSEVIGLAYGFANNRDILLLRNVQYRSQNRIIKDQIIQLMELM